jgi:hypothetical protein
MPLTTEKILSYCDEVISMINVDLAIVPTNRLPIRATDPDGKLFKHFGTIDKYLSYLEKSIEPIMEQQRSALDELFSQKDLSQEKIIEKIAAFSQHTKVGNCEQMACLAFVFLKELIPQKSIELVTTDNHMFVVIGRNQKSDIANPATYGSEAVICDPWARRSYKATTFFIERDLYRPAAPTDIFSPGSYLKGKPALYHSYIPEEKSDKPDSPAP